MKVRHLILLVSFIVTASISYGDIRDYVPPLTKIPTHGITLTTPDEKGWFFFDPDGKGRYLVKAGQTNSETYAITVSYYNNSPSFKSEQEFFDSIIRRNRGSSKRFKMRIANEELNASRGTYFAYYYGLSEDHEAHEMPKDKRFALLEIRGFYARHPNDPSLLIQVEYSYRYYEGHEDPDFMKKADWVLNNAILTKL